MRTDGFRLVPRSSWAMYACDTLARLARSGCGPLPRFSEPLHPLPHVGGHYRSSDRLQSSVHRLPGPWPDGSTPSRPSPRHRGSYRPRQSGTHDAGGPPLPMPLARTLFVCLLQGDPRLTARAKMGGPLAADPREPGRDAEGVEELEVVAVLVARELGRRVVEANCGRGLQGAEEGAVRSNLRSSMVMANVWLPILAQAPWPVLMVPSVMVATRPPSWVKVTSAPYQSGKVGVPVPPAMDTRQEPSSAPFDAPTVSDGCTQPPRTGWPAPRSRSTRLSV